MTTGLHHDVRRTFAAHADEVEVPPIDQVAFQQHIRRARHVTRRRRTTWLAAGVGVVAAGVAGAILATNLIDEARPTSITDGPAKFATAESPTPPVLLTGVGRVALVDHGSTYAANVEIGRTSDVYRTAHGVLVVDWRSAPRQVRVKEASGAEPIEVDTPELLAPAVDNLTVSADGRTGAWFGLDQGEVEFVFYDFARERAMFTEPIRSDGASETIITVDSHQAIIEVDGQVEIWDATGRRSLALELDDYQSTGDWNSGVLALPRADRSATDMFSIEDGRSTLVSSVPLGSGRLSPAGDNVLGFTPYGVDGPHEQGQDRRYVEVWSADGQRRSGFTGLPKTVYEFTWLDNDTIALTGGPGGGTWPGALDTYTCELSDLTCIKVADDETGPEDALPMLASGRGL